MARQSLTQAQRWVLGGLAAVALLLGLAVVITRSADDGESATATTTTPSSTTSTTTTPDDSTTTSFVPDVDPFAVAYPSPTSSQSFEDPVAAARSYATEVLGFTALTLGPYEELSDDGGRVTVSARTDGPATAIEVSQRSGAWYAMSSSTPDITVTNPSPGDSLATPFETVGTAVAFEGTVDVLILAQDGLSQMGAGFVQGSGYPPAGPFSGRIFFSPPGRAEAGVLIFRTLSAEDGRVEQATSFRVRLTSNQLSTPPEECGDTGETDGETPADDVRVVKVYFHCGFDIEEVVALRRTVPTADPAVLTQTLDQLVRGPTASERSAGFTSVFPVEGGEVRRVVIADGVATVDLSAEYAGLANSSYNILALRAELFRTATQFSSVAAVEVFFEGSCADFAEWSQSDSCLLTD